ncbi:hypothetical protein AVEN_36601-1, partial [Araneus ventricosus]
SHIETAVQKNDNLMRERKQCGKDEDVEGALKEWFLKGRRLSKKMGKDDFRASKGWCHRWKKKESNAFVKPHGEQGDADRRRMVAFDC